MCRLQWKDSQANNGRKKEIEEEDGRRGYFSISVEYYSHEQEMHI